MFGNEDETNPFWQFSLHVYAAPGVADGLIALQDRTGADVNLMLFVLWLGVWHGHRLSAEEVHHLRIATDPWQVGMVKPIRAVRRRLTRGAGVRSVVLALELEAERFEQDLLRRLGPTSACWVSDTPVAADAVHSACTNLAVLLGTHANDWWPVIDQMAVAAVAAAECGGDFRSE